MWKKSVLRAVGAAVGAMCALTAAAQTYTSTSAPVPITDNNTTVFNTMTVAVPDTFVVTSLSVTVGFTQTFAADVANLALVAPSGEIITLALPAGSGSTGDNFKNTTFDQRAALEIPSTAADAPFRKRYRASTTLGSGQISLAAAQTLGLQANGTWTLRCNDDASNDFGSIDYVILSLNERVFVGGEIAATPNLSNNVMVPPGTNPSIPGAPTQSQTGLTISIPDADAATGASSTLVVSAADAQFIAGVDLSFSVTHPSLSDLRVRLTHPNGTTSVDVIIPGAIGGSATTPNTDAPSTPVGVNRPYVTTLADGADALSGGVAPYRGKFAPSNALAAFNGLTSNGTWTLTVFDEVVGNTGSIREWSLHVRGGAAAPSGVGSATPSSVVQGSMTTLSVVVTPAIALSSVTSVVADVSGLTGNSSPDNVALTQVGATSTWSASVLAVASLGAKTIPFTIAETGTVGNGAGSIAVTIVPAAPANPTCASATSVTTFPFVSGPINVGGSLDDASINPSCDTGTVAGNPLWFAITPATTQVYQILETTSVNVAASVWTGTCGALTQVGCEASSVDGSAGYTVVLNAGTTYYVVLSRRTVGGGSLSDAYNITINRLTAPANDNCGTAQVVTAPTNLAATSIDARGALPDIGLTCNGAGFTTSTVAGIWYQVNNPTSDAYTVTFAETGSATDAIWGAYTGSCGALAPVACLVSDTANTYSIFPGQTLYLLVGRQFASATTAPQPSGNPTYTLSVTFAILNSACCNTTLNTCTVISRTACLAQTPPGAWAGPTSVTCSAATSAANACQAAPVNDTCATATAITGALPAVFSTPFPAAATDDLDSTCNSPTSGGGTPPAVTRFGVWYSYTTGADGGALNFSQTNSAIDTVRQIYSGTCGTLTPVACFDAETNQTVAIPANTTYYILLGMFGNSGTPASAYGFSVNSFTPATGACCVDGSCSVGVTASACAGAWLGANSVCAIGPTYSYPGPSVGIPDNSLAGVSNTINVSGAVDTITNLKVQVGLNHAFAGDVKVTLTGPNAAAVDLIARPGATTNCSPLVLTSGVFGSGNDFAGIYVLDDAAADNINTASAANAVLAAGNYRPSTCAGVDSNLAAAFNGISPNGAWTITVYDAGAAVVGTLSSWGVIVNDVVISPCDHVGACCSGASCSLVANAAACPGDPGNFQGAGTTCSPTNPCGTSAEFCCRGTTCAEVATGSCTGTVVGSSSVVVASCGAGNSSASCCFADFNHTSGVTIDDLFLYLNAYFTSSPYANFGGDTVANPTIDDLFLYINAYFTGCQP